MIVTDLTQYNTAVRRCGCCGLPTCAENTILCQGVSHTTECAADDYTDAMRIWNAKVDAHDAWESDEASFAARHALWVDEKADWDACRATIPCEECGPEPVEPVHADEPPDPGTEPTKPAGYDDVLHGCFGPFAEPEGDPDVEIGTLYGTFDTISEVDFPDFSGSGWNYTSTVFGGGIESWEALNVATHTTEVYDINHTGNQWDSSAETCTPYSGPGSSLGAPPDPYVYDPEDDYAPYTMGAVTDVCTATQNGTTQTGTWTSGSPTPPALLGCPESGDFAETSDSGWDYEITVAALKEVGEPKTKSSLIARAIANLPAWDDDEELTTTVGAGCIAETTALWPTIRDLYREGDPEAEPPVPDAWRDCDLVEEFPWVSVPVPVEATATKRRYKRGIPLHMQAHRLWIIEHAEWVINHARWVFCGSEVGSEPVEPVEPTILYTYYKIMSDVVEFSAEWEAWRVLWDEFVLKTAEKEEWDACELLTPGECGEEPVVPADPTSSQPAQPTFIATDLTWTFTGGEDLEDQFEPTWQEIAPPTSASHQRRIVNRRSWCYQSARTGVPPTLHGEILDLDEYPA